jgi:hypothetical protein
MTRLGLITSGPGVSSSTDMTSPGGGNIPEWWAVEARPNPMPAYDIHSLGRRHGRMGQMTQTQWNSMIMIGAIGLGLWALWRWW